MIRHHLLSEDLLCKNLLDPVQAVDANGYFHAQGLTNQVTNGIQLVRVEMDGHQ